MADISALTVKQRDTELGGEKPHELKIKKGLAMAGLI
jgi:hypothetical protein